MPRSTWEERFRARIPPRPDTDEYGAGCMVWRGAVRKKDGYGTFKDRDGHTRYAHDLAMEEAGVEKPPGKMWDHLCRNRLCVRYPIYVDGVLVSEGHFEAVTNRVNTLRGEHPNAVAYREGRCAKGHIVAGRNAMKLDGRVRCRICFDRMRRKSAAKAKRRAA